MNKYIKSLDFITKKVCENCNSAVGCTGCDVLKSKQVIEELIEKLTPKKVIELSKRDRGYKHICPSCEQFVGTIALERYHNRYQPSHIEEDEYCCSCGQRLDWRDDNG